VWELFHKKIARRFAHEGKSGIGTESWYWVSTDINNRESVFRLSREVRLLREVLGIYQFEVRGLRVEEDRVSFYINAVDGVAVILLNREQLPQKSCSNFEKFEKNHFFCGFFALG
jgi:hypothetical protein